MRFKAEVVAQHLAVNGCCPLRRRFQDDIPVLLTDCISSIHLVHTHALDGSSPGEKQSLHVSLLPDFSHAAAVMRRKLAEARDKLAGLEATIGTGVLNIVAGSCLKLTFAVTTR